MNPSTDLVIRKTIAASSEHLFRAWTDPDQLVDWWGPEGVTCDGAEVDLRVGGRYRISNRLPDGRVVWISGEYEVIEPPNKLVYSWRLGEGDGPRERVTVRFEPKGMATEVTIVHERIPDPKTQSQHELGWIGCLKTLDSYLAG